jgi:hypothetical protein
MSRGDSVAFPDALLTTFAGSHKSMKNAVITDPVMAPLHSVVPVQAASKGPGKEQMINRTVNVSPPLSNDITSLPMCNQRQTVPTSTGARAETAVDDHSIRGHQTIQ